MEGGSPGARWFELSMRQLRGQFVKSGGLSNAEIDRMLELFANPEWAAFSDHHGVLGQDEKGLSACQKPSLVGLHKARTKSLSLIRFSPARVQCRPLAQNFICCETGIRPESGAKRKWLTRAQNVADDPNATSVSCSTCLSGCAKSLSVCLGEGDETARFHHGALRRGGSLAACTHAARDQGCREQGRQFFSGSVAR